jgi:hypothetical protein
MAPTIMVQVSDNTGLQAVAEEADAKLRAALAALEKG